MIGLILLGMAAASGGWSWHLASEANKLRERLGLLRNLQVGVVQVDTDDFVLEANDRAEELFGRKLPKYGTAAPRVNFRDLIDLRIVREPGGALDAGPRFAEISLSEIDRLRRNGEASDYYGRLSRGKDRRWVSVAATPMMLADPKGRRRETVKLANIFASISEVPAEVAGQLDAHVSCEPVTLQMPPHGEFL
jgi:PAS domain-containing protein